MRRENNHKNAEMSPNQVPKYPTIYEDLFYNWDGIREAYRLRKKKVSEIRESQFKQQRRRVGNC